MRELTRRGFLKVTGAAAAALLAAKLLPPGLTVFDEQPVRHTASKDWITDRGDYWEVVIPAGKRLSREVFDKPLLLMMGQDASFVDCVVLGFANLYAKPNVSLIGNHFDARQLASVKERPLLTIKRSDSQGALLIDSCIFDQW